MMRMTCGQLKLAARQCLKGKYGTSILMIFLYMIASFLLQIPYQIINMVSSIFLGTGLRFVAFGFYGLLFIYYIAMSVVLGTLVAGMTWFFYQMTAGRPFEVKDLGYYFTHGYKKFLGIYGLFFLYSIIPVVVAGLISGFCVAWNHAGFIGSGLLAVIVGMVSLMAAVVWYLICLRYALIYYIYGENQQLRVTEVFRESARLMEGNKARAFRLGLSFMGMIFLAMMSFGIGFLWIMPYIQCAWSQLYINIKEEKGPRQYQYL